MKITQTLLRKYIAGQCTEAETRFIEQWMNSAEGVRSDYSNEEVSEMKKGTWDKLRKNYQLTSSFEKLEKKILAASNSESKRVKIVSLYQIFFRYAAAACIIIGIFAAGFSTGFTFAKPSADMAPKDLLYVYGSRGARLQLKGDNFNVGIEGNLRLYNGSLSSKRISCGDQQFVLQPRQTYYLSGSDGDATLLDEEHLLERGTNAFSLEGGFSIISTDD